MERNNIPKVMAFLLALALVSTSMLSGTFAKYSSEFAGQDTALVAKWEFGTVIGQDLNNLGDPMETGVSNNLDLFGHEYNKHIVASEGGVFIIAPGVESMFTLVFTNKSDVSAKAEVEFEVTSESALVPIEFNVPESFYIDDGTLIITPSATWITLGALSAEMVNRIDILYDPFGFVEKDGDGIIISPVENGDAMVIMPISWRWPFERPNAGDDDGDAEDTGLGMESASGDDRTEYELLVTVKATQVQPE